MVRNNDATTEPLTNAEDVAVGDTIVVSGASFLPESPLEVTEVDPEWAERYDGRVFYASIPNRSNARDYTFRVKESGFVDTTGSNGTFGVGVNAAKVVDEDDEEDDSTEDVVTDGGEDDVTPDEVDDALTGVDHPSPYHEPAHYRVDDHEDGVIVSSKKKYGKHENIKPCQTRALDDAGLEWHFKEDGRFADGVNRRKVIVTGRVDDVDDSTDDDHDDTDADREDDEDEPDIWSTANEADRRLLGGDDRDPVNEGEPDEDVDDTEAVATDGGHEVDLDPNAETDASLPGVSAHDLSEGDRVEVEASPMGRDGSGTIAGEVTEAKVFDDERGFETGTTVRIHGDDGRDYVRKGTGSFFVEDDDDFLVAIAYDSTLRREAATDGGVDEDDPMYELSDEEREYFDALFDDDADDVERPESLGGPIEDTEPAKAGDPCPIDECPSCGEESGDIRLHAETHEWEEVVSYDRIHPQTGERMGVETERRVDGYLIPMCPTCRGEEPATDGGHANDDSTCGHDRLVARHEAAVDALIDADEGPTTDQNFRALADREEELRNERVRRALRRENAASPGGYNAAG